MSMCKYVKFTAVAYIVFCGFSVFVQAVTDRKNIVYIAIEDITPMMVCYGDSYARIPVFDKLSDEGIKQIEKRTSLEKEWLFQAGNNPTVQRVQDEIIWTRQLAERIGKEWAKPSLLSVLIITKRRYSKKQHWQFALNKKQS